MTDEAARPPAPSRQRTACQRGAWQVAAIAALLVLSGCTTSPTPPTASSTVAGQSPAATQVDTPPLSPGPAPVPAYMPATANAPAQNVPTPVLPEKAKEFSKEGLEAFARHWYSTLGYAYETGDVAPMTAITDPGCKPCSNVGGPVNEWFAAGNWIVGGLMTIHSASSSFEKAPNGTYQAILMAQQSPVSYINADGTLDTAYPPTIARADIVVAIYSYGSWTARTVEHLAKD
ncbi:DUF6318 family protein [Arthrobacter alpinus]|uniref:DUF6318 family protein n=1 Tax=Arthrobacter alpinus TaxID=656366 RepID=UPI0016463093|nr:DUF6318 family protein [Arthrobacter alpinus]